MSQNKSVEEKSQSEEWGAWKFVAEMLDTPHPDETLAKCGIYNTSKCYEQIHDFVVEQKEKVRQTSQERERCGKEMPDGSICGVKLDCHLHDWRQKDAIQAFIEALTGDLPFPEDRTRDAILALAREHNLLSTSQE